MTTTEPTPEELSAVTNIIARFCASLTTSEDAARAILSAGYVHLITHLNSLTASERLELGDALCREAAEMDGDDDEEECIDDTDLCEHGLRFGCEECSPPLAFMRPTPGGGL